MATTLFAVGFVIWVVLPPLNRVVDEPDIVVPYVLALPLVVAVTGAVYELTSVWVFEDRNAKCVKPFAKASSALRSIANSSARSPLVNPFPLNETLHTSGANWVSVNPPEKLWVWYAVAQPNSNAVSGINLKFVCFICNHFLGKLEIARPSNMS